jgi:hypothetical protein
MTRLRWDCQSNGARVRRRNETRIWILCGAVPINPVMQVRRAAASVTRVAGVTDDLTRLHAIAFTEDAVPSQVRVVVSLEAWTENPDCLAAESILADTRHDAARRTEYGRVSRREYVDAFMSASTRPRVAPRVDEPRSAARGQRAGQCGCWFLDGQRIDEPGAVNERPGCQRKNTQSDSHDQQARERFHGTFSAYGTVGASASPARRQNASVAYVRLDLPEVDGPATPLQDDMRRFLGTLRCAQICAVLWYEAIRNRGTCQRAERFIFRRK